MKAIYIFVFFWTLSFNLYAAPATGTAVVATHTVSSSTGIYFENSTITMTSIDAGTTPPDYTQDLYSAVSNRKLLELLLQTTPVLTDGFGNTIPLTYSFTSIATGATTSILDNTWIDIIPNGNPSFRDGVTSPGYIVISTGPVPSTQAAGSYSTGPIAVDVRLDGKPSTAIGYLSINTIVNEFIVIGFIDTSAYITGIKFVGNDIDFGLMNKGETPLPITRDVFVHTNKNADIQIAFSNTPALLSSVDGVSTINVNYSYTLNATTANIVAGVPFIASSGINDGTTSVGSITFTPDTLTSTQAAGAYSTTVNVVVSAM